MLPILLAMLISPARTLAVILLLHSPKGALMAVAVILTANLSVAASLVNFVFSVLIQVVCFVLIAIYLLMPERSAALYCWRRCIRRRADEQKRRRPH